MREEDKLTSSVSSPDRGCGFGGPPGVVWYPAALQSVSGTSSSAAAQSAAYPHYLSANQPAAAPIPTHNHMAKNHTDTHTFFYHFFHDSSTHIFIIVLIYQFVSWFSFVRKTLLPSSQAVFWTAARSPASHQTPAGVSFWWSPFHEQLGCILSATHLLEETCKIQSFRCCLPSMQA